MPDELAQPAAAARHASDDDADEQASDGVGDLHARAYHSTCRLGGSVLGPRLPGEPLLLRGLGRVRASRRENSAVPVTAEIQVTSR